MKKACILCVFLTVVHLVVCPATAEPKDTSIHTDKTIHLPSQEVASAWLENGLKSHETWMFSNFNTFVTLAKKHGVALPSSKPPIEDPSAQFFAEVSLEWKASLPRAFLKEVYWHQLLIGSPYLEYIEFKSNADFLIFLTRAQITGGEAQRLWRQHIYPSGSYFILPITPDLAPLMNKKTWLAVSLYIQSQNQYEDGLQAFLYVGPKASPAEIADYYRALKDPSTMEAGIKRAREYSPKDHFTVPLHNILSPGIRNHYGTFSSCDGPNCFYSGISARRDSKMQPREIEHEELRGRLATGYHKVRRPYFPGDLLAFSNQNGIHHTLVLVSESDDSYLVWEKPGRFKTEPFTFRSWEKSTSAYGDKGDLILQAYRHNTCARIMSGLGK